MAEIRIVAAGSKPLFEIVKSDDGSVVTIRLAEDLDEKIDIPSSLLGTLIRTLQEFAE